jgi:hypothetical protein
MGHLSDSTLLELTGIDLGDYSCRGLTMTLTPVASQNGLRRTINGGLLDLTAPQFRKYSAAISCEDQDAPELIGIWQGMPVTVVCVPGLAGGTDNPSATLTLSMLVDTWDTSRDEWNALTNWTIHLLEA